MNTRALFIAALAWVSPAIAQRPAPRKIQAGEGVFVFITAPYSDVGLDGNSVAIIARDGVLVFDSNGTPAAAEAVLGEIRKLTDQPVRYLVNSHWHWDHWYGAEVYRRAFPAIQIITHEATRRMMLGPALVFNQPGLDEQLPQHIAEVEQALKAAEAGGKPPSDLARLRRHVEDDRFFLGAKRAVHHTVANLTYTDSLTIYLGEREIKVLHYDRAVTPGDTFLYLPAEQLLITGDLLVNPISFALSAYPTSWLNTLERMEALETTAIIPGHGEPLHDKEMLHTNVELLRALLRSGKEAKANGLSAKDATAAAYATVHDLMVKLTHDDPQLNGAFRVYMVEWLMQRIYAELDGPLDDAIAKP
ncbi:MAG: MBL fold metallo-hydrolase [Gemmatimonadota bacterium]